MAGRRALFTLLCAALFVPQPAAAQPPASSAPDPASPPAQAVAPADAQRRYDALLAAVKQRDPSADLRELRNAFTETPAYRATMMSAYQALWGPLTKGDFAAALQVAEKVLAFNYVEINAHLVASVAHQQLGNAAAAQYHLDLANGLLQTVMSSGDGRTADTPWVVIDISEEYAVMRALGLAAQSQALAEKDGVSLDVVQVVDLRTKEPRTLYFNVSRSMAAMTSRRPNP
jgi:hypothetical protein